MSDSFTVNKNIDMPSAGSYVNAWATPVNSNFDIIDDCLGGTTNISVTGVSSNVALSIAQYQPPNIEFFGTLSANLVYYVPAGVGGVWSFLNSTTGNFTLSFGIASGNSFILPFGRTQLLSNGVSVGPTNNVYFDSLVGQIAPTQVPAAAVTQYQGSLTIATSQLSGTVANENLPNIATLPGVTIQADPGTTPSGTYGDIFFYY